MYLAAIIVWGIHKRYPMALPRYMASNQSLRFVIDIWYEYRLILDRDIYRDRMGRCMFLPKELEDITTDVFFLYNEILMEQISQLCNVRESTGKRCIAHTKGQ